MCDGVVVCVCVVVLLFGLLIGCVVCVRVWLRLLYVMLCGWLCD